MATFSSRVQGQNPFKRAALLAFTVVLVVTIPGAPTVAELSLESAANYYANASLLDVAAQVATILAALLMFYQHLRNRKR
jgi:hypothetical protein